MIYAWNKHIFMNLLRICCNKVKTNKTALAKGHWHLIILNLGDQRCHPSNKNWTLGSSSMEQCHLENKLKHSYRNKSPTKFIKKNFSDAWKLKACGNKNLIQEEEIVLHVQVRSDNMSCFVWRLLEALKIYLQIKVGWVLKNLGNSLFNGHWDIWIWTIGSWDNWV